MSEASSVVPEGGWGGPGAGADGRSRQPRGQRRREAILAAAIELLSQKGFRGTSIVEIAERAGVKHTALLYYFGNKDRLLGEVVAERVREERESYLDALRAEGPSLSGLASAARLTVQDPTFTRLYVVLAAENVDAGEPLNAFFRERYAQGRRLFAEGLRNEISKGNIRADVDVEQVALEALAVLMGLEQQWLMDPEAIDLVGAVERYVDGVRASLAPQGATGSGRNVAARDA